MNLDLDEIFREIDNEEPKDRPSKVGQASAFSNSDYNYCETAVGSISNRNKIIKLSDLGLHDISGEAYASLYRYTAEVADYVRQTGSIKGLKSIPVWSDYLWIDIDSTDLQVAQNGAQKIIENIQGIDTSLCKHALVYFSGHKGFHLGIPSHYAGLVPSSNLPERHKKLALLLSDGIDIDLTIYRHNQLFRLPNTLNVKSGLYKIQLSLEQLSTLTPDQIKKLAEKKTGHPYYWLLPNGDAIQPSPRLTEMQSMNFQPDRGSEVPAYSGDESDSKDPDWINQRLQNLRAGNRHNAFTEIIGWLISDKKTPNSIYSLLKPYAERSGFPVDELEDLVTDVVSRYGDMITFPFDSYNIEKTQTEFKAVTLTELLAEKHSELRWYIEGLVPEESTTFFAGPAGSGKSFLLMDASLALATGSLFLGSFETKKASVLYIDEENNPQTIAGRFSRLIKGRGLSAPPENLHICSAQGVLLDKPRSLAALDRMLEKIKPNVVIIDTLKRVITSEENSATEMSRVFAGIKHFINKYKIAFIIADHHKKPGKSGNSPNLLLRGSTDKAAFVDSLITVRKSGDKITVTQTKSRCAKESEAVLVELTDSSDHAIKINPLGLAREVQNKDRNEIVLDMILDEIGDDCKSRKELVAWGKENETSEQSIDAALKYGIEIEALAREEHKKSGRGGKQHRYKRYDVN